MLLVLWFVCWYLSFSKLGNTTRSKKILLDLVLHIFCLRNCFDLDGELGIPTTLSVTPVFHMLFELSDGTAQDFLPLILGEVKCELTSPGCTVLVLESSVFLLKSVFKKHASEGN